MVDGGGLVNAPLLAGTLCTEPLFNCETGSPMKLAVWSGSPWTISQHLRTNGYTLESAWWIFNRLGTLTAHRWSDAHKDVDAVWNPLQKSFIDEQPEIDKLALEIYNKKPAKAVEFLTKYSKAKGAMVMKTGIKLGDKFWTKYDEKF